MSPGLARSSTMWGQTAVLPSWRATTELGNHSALSSPSGPSAAPAARASSRVLPSQPAKAGVGSATGAGSSRARQTVVEGKSVSVRGDLGGRWFIKKQNEHQYTETN